MSPNEQPVTEIRSLVERLTALCAEIWQAHTDPSSPDYSPDEPCDWCRETQAAFAALADRAAGPPCIWTPDDDGAYDTGCGNRYVFDFAGPLENRQHFCGYCGRGLEVGPLGSITPETEP